MIHNAMHGLAFNRSASYVWHMNKDIPSLDDNKADGKTCRQVIHRRLKGKSAIECPRHFAFFDFLMTIQTAIIPII
jgi:hypothetical protein